MNTSTSGAVAAPPARRGGDSQSAWRGRALLALAAGFVVCIGLLAVEPDRAFGLPAHPLLVHLPVVADPLLAIAAIVVVLRGDWRRRFGLALGALAVVALASTVLAAGAGEQLLAHSGERSALLHDHQEAADTLRLLLFALTAAILLLLARDWDADRRGHPLGGRAAAVALSAGIVALAGATGFFVVRTGHLGAKSAWQDAAQED